MAHHSHATRSDHAIHRAARLGDLRTLAALLRRGVPANLGNARDASPLILAAEQGHAAACRLLLQAGAHTEVRSVHGVTALYMAVFGRHRVVVHTLLAAGANPCIWDRDGVSILFWAAQHRDAWTLSRLALAMGNSLPAHGDDLPPSLRAWAQGVTRR